MHRLQSVLLIVALAAFGIGQIGCGSTGGSGGPCCQMGVYTELSTGIWPNASVYGNVDPTSTACTVGTGYCNGSFNGTTDANGNYRFSTDALPGYWSVGALSDSNCSGGGSTSGTVNNNQTINIYCGSVAAGTATASPSGCTDFYDLRTRTETTNCPATITLTTSAPELPTYAVTVSTYDDIADELSSSPTTPSSSTTIIVSTPSQEGTIVLTIIDPDTNQALASADFIRQRQTFWK